MIFFYYYIEQWNQ